MCPSIARGAHNVVTSAKKRRLEIHVCSTYAPFFGAIFEGGVLAPPPFAMEGEEQGGILLPILLTLSDGAKESLNIYLMGELTETRHNFCNFFADLV